MEDTIALEADDVRIRISEVAGDLRHRIDAPIGRDRAVNESWVARLELLVAETSFLPMFCWR